MPPSPPGKASLLGGAMSGFAVAIAVVPTSNTSRTRWYVRMMFLIE